MGEYRETAEQRFKRLASLRTSQVLDRLRILSNCSNRQVYKYTKEDVDRIFSAIEKKAKEAKARFNQPKKKEQFRL